MSSVDPLSHLRDALDEIAQSTRPLSHAECHVFVDQAAAVIKAVVGHLPPRCTQHLAAATAAMAGDALPRFIHEIEAAIMHAETH